MKIYFVIIALLLALTLTSGVGAEDVNLDEIVITASRIEESYGDISRNMDIITSGGLETEGAQNLADALTGLTSVDISDYGGPGATKTIRMRGSSAAQVLILVDGRPVNNPRDGQTDLTSIPLDNISRIEVVHGPGSSLYGTGAMGGTVNIITKGPPKKGQKTEFYSSFGTARTYVERLSQGAKISKFAYLINGEYQSSEGFRENSAFNAKDCNLKLEYEPNDQNNLKLNSGFYKSRVGAPGPTIATDLDDKQNVLRRFFDFNWDFKLGSESNVSAKIYQNYDRLEFIENSTDYTKDIHGTTVRGLNLQLNKEIWKGYRVVCGIDYSKNINDSTSTAKHEYSALAGYLQNHFSINQSLKANLGLRVDDYSNFGTEVSPNFDFLYTFKENFKIHGLVSRSFRIPTFNDLYWPRRDYYYSGFWVGGEEGNLNLKPEKGITAETGIEVKLNKYITSGLTYYHSDYNELIQWADDGSWVWRPENVGSASMNGIEFQNKINISDRLELNIDYTYLRAMDDKTHKFLVYQPKHKVDSSVKYTSSNGLTAELKGQFTGARFYDTANTIKVKSFFVLGLSVTKKINSVFSCFANIDNLLNRKYQVIKDYPMPGFAFTGGMKLEF